MKKGDIVQYVCEFDADLNDVMPNVYPAVVTKVNRDTSLNLQVFFLNGIFTKIGVKQGDPNTRETWYL